MEDLRSSRVTPIAIETRRGSGGYYWGCLETGIVVVSDAPFTGNESRGVLIPLGSDWSIRIEAARRLRTIMQGRHPRPWFTEQRRTRISLALRTNDARQSGARFRDVAITYFGAHRVASEAWKTSTLKAQVARLARYGQALVGDGYRQLLRGSTALNLRK